MKFPVKIQIPVAWGEMDAFGHVNNVVFFRYFESARIAYFRQLTEGDISSDSFLPILASTEATYLSPVQFPDTLVAEAAVSQVGNSSFTMQYRLTSQEQGQIVAQGKAVVVNINPESGKGSPLSDQIKQRISTLQG